jgi:PAS domain S-box-containing protein
MNTKLKKSNDLAARRRRGALELRELYTQQKQRPMMAELYRLAEAKLRMKQKGQQSKAGPPKTETNPERLFHELEVHQIELEMQNAELRQVRDELEASLENYTDLYDFAPAGYFTLATSGTIRQVNLTGAQFVGLERSRLVGWSFAQLVSPAQRPAVTSFLKQVFAGQDNLSIDVELLVKGRPLLVVRVRAKRSPTGLDCRVVLVDITGLKREEDKVRVSETRYRRLFEAAHDGVLILDPGTRKITDANPFMTKLLGYPQHQLVGKELFEIGLLKDEAASRKMFEKLKIKHEVRYEDLPLETQAGRHQEVEVVANLYSENGRAVIQCNIRDITQRKQAEDVLRRSEALFSTLIEQAPVGVYVVDSQLRLRQVNPKAQPVFKDFQPLIGRDFSTVIHHIWPKKTAAEIVGHFQSTLRTGEPYYSPEFSERRRDTGLTEFYEWQLQRVVLPVGEQGVVCFFSNLTERKKTEGAQRRLEVLAASNRKLESEIARRQVVEESLKQSEQQQTRLLDQSHSMQEQLRNLSRQVLQAQEDERKRISRELHDVIAQTLTGINIRLASLKNGAGLSPGEFERDIELTQKLVENSVNTVHQFARELRPAVLDDLGLVPALHAFLKNFTAQTGVHAHLTAFAGLEQLDASRRTILYRVAQEALTNVSRHAQASRVEVIIQKLAGGICMKINDNGRSFSVERLLQGNGGKRLGLLGMRERLEMVGGRFEIASAPGQGTTVTAEIPFVVRDGAAAGSERQNRKFD